MYVFHYQGEEYRLQDVLVRFGTIYINNRDQGCLVVDVGVHELINL